MFGKHAGKLFGICEWIMKLAYVNLLWIVFSVVGLFLLGFMPATVALFTIVRKWLKKDVDIPIWSTFLTVYRNEFWKANGYGLIIASGGFLIYLDGLYLWSSSGVAPLALVIPLFLLGFAYVITILYIFPVYVHYDVRILESFRTAFFLALLNLHMTLYMLAGIVGIVILVMYMPSLFPFFGVVSAAFIIMSGGIYSFDRILAKQKKINGTVVTEE